MKRLLTGFFILVFCSRVGTERRKMDPFATITEMVDSAGHKADTLLEAEVKEEPKPMEADELFDDFIFNYASDEALQRARTEFPLPYYNRDTPSKIEERFWKHDSCLPSRIIIRCFSTVRATWTWWATLR